MAELYLSALLSRPCRVQDLTYYEHEKIVTKSLYIVNKYFCTRTDVFRVAVESQVNAHHNLQLVMIYNVVSLENDSRQAAIHSHLLTFPAIYTAAHKQYIVRKGKGK